jgi:UDP-N-acetylglucosamine acyltransferase
MIAGASALSQDVPPYCLVEGNRAVLRGLNLNGLRRHVERTDIDALRSAYRDLFESGQPLQETANTLFNTTSSQYVKNMATFILNTKRGIPFERKES